MCVCMAESLHCSPETITTLLISCTPTQNKKLIIKKRRSLLSQCLQGEAMVLGNNFFDGYFPFRKFPTCKNVQITEITFYLIAHTWTIPSYLR